MNDIKELIGTKLSIEALIGRGFYHYTNGFKDEEQPLVLELQDLDLDSSQLEEADMPGDDMDCREGCEEEYEDEDEYEFETLEDYIGESCWVKRFATTEDETCDEAYIIIGLDVDRNMVVSSYCSALEYVRRPGMGMFMIPGIEVEGVSVFQENNYFPERVFKELEQLIKGQYLSSGFSFKGKPLPQAMIHEGGNGGSISDYTYALQSAYRQCYMHMSVYTTEDGIIEELDYSSYQSTGSGWGDMFSRPMSIGDRSDEAVDMLLHLIDKYNDEELKEVLIR